MQAGLYQFVSAAEVGDELSDGDAIRIAVVDSRVIQGAGGNAAVVFRLRAGKTAEGLRVVRRARLRHLSFRGSGQVTGG